MFFYSNEVEWENFKLKNLLMFEDLNKLEIWLETCNIGKELFDTLET
jgi:hypothetical protein